MLGILKTFAAFFYTCYMCCLFLIQFPLIIMCTLLEFMKISLFDKYEIPINQPIEYTYFVLALFQLVSTGLFTCIHSCLNNMEVLKWQTRISTLLWLVIPILYTYFTVHELEPIPFFCPANYSYISNSYRSLCIVRTSNVICMWFMFFITLCFTIRSFIPAHEIDDWFGINIKNDSNNHKNEKEKEKEKGSEISMIA